MKIDFKTPDNSLQIKILQNLLQKVEPTKEDLVIAMLLTVLIFYENRPGKIKGLPGYFSHGTGCHNPTSLKSGKTLWGIWRLEIIIENTAGTRLDIKYEYVIGGYLKAVFKDKEDEWIVGADINKGDDKETVSPAEITVMSKNNETLMQKINKFLNEPLTRILIVNNPIEQE
jgi:hypothetical protein